MLSRKNISSWNLITPFCCDVALCSVSVGWCSVLTKETSSFHDNQAALKIVSVTAFNKSFRCAFLIYWKQQLRLRILLILHSIQNSTLKI